MNEWDEIQSFRKERKKERWCEMWWLYDLWELLGKFERFEERRDEGFRVGFGSNTSRDVFRLLHPEFVIYSTLLQLLPQIHHLNLPFHFKTHLQHTYRLNQESRETEEPTLLTLRIELRLRGLQYTSVCGSSLNIHIAATEAWHPCVTTLPSGHVSIRSRRSTTYCTTGSSSE